MLVQVYTPTLEYGGDELKEMYNIIEEILEKDGKGDANTITMSDWGSGVGDKYRGAVSP